MPFPFREDPQISDLHSYNLFEFCIWLRRKKIRKEAGRNLFWEILARFQVHTYTHFGEIHNYGSYMLILQKATRLLETHRTVLDPQSNIFIWWHWLVFTLLTLLIKDGMMFQFLFIYQIQGYSTTIMYNNQSTKINKKSRRSILDFLSKVKLCHFPPNKKA